MSVVQQVISDARKLAKKLTEHDNSMDALLSQTQGVIKQVECMKEYCEEMNELNDSSNSRPRIALIRSIQQENRHIKELQKENKELRQALEEHQNIMELIMSKYRQQIGKLVSVRRCPTNDDNAEDQAKLRFLLDRVNEMVAVMRRAALLSDHEFERSHDAVVRLTTENKGLRQLLEIAGRSGSLSPSASAAALTILRTPARVTDAHTQTTIDERTSPLPQPNDASEGTDDEGDDGDDSSSSNLLESPNHSVTTRMIMAEEEKKEAES